MKINLISTDWNKHSIINLAKITSIYLNANEIRFHYRGGWSNWDFESPEEAKEHYEKLKETHSTNITNIIKFK
jgi:hypothetical protein